MIFENTKQNYELLQGNKRTQIQQERDALKCLDSLVRFSSITNTSHIVFWD